jgi:hypothetical protein
MYKEEYNEYRTFSTRIGILVGLLVFMTIMLLTSCDNSIDVFKGDNKSPEFLIRSENTEYSNELIDSFRIGEKTYTAIVKLKDDLENDNLSISYKNNTEYQCTLEIKDSTLLLKEYSAGQYDIDIVAMDSYGLFSIVNLKVFFYENLPPVPHLSFKLVGDNYQVNASKSYDPDPDGEITNYNFDYGVNSINYSEPVVEIWAKHIEQNEGVTLVLTDNNGAKSEPKFFGLNEN